MFFIFGSPRSGTTLLAQTLNLHQSIAVPRETDFIIPLAMIVRRVKSAKKGKQLIYDFIVNADRSSHSVGEYLKPRHIHEAIDRADYTVSSLLTELYSSIAQKKGKRIGGDKSPNDLQHVNEIINAGTFQDGRVKAIHLVRDPRDVLLSIHNAKLIPMNHSKTFFPRAWSNANLYVQTRMQQFDDQYYQLRYEDFVAQPEHYAKEICAFLGVDFDENMLSTKRTKRFKRVSAHSNINKPFSTSSIGKWKKDMPEPVAEMVVNQAREAMQHFGYLE